MKKTIIILILFLASTNLVYSQETSSSCPDEAWKPSGAKFCQTFDNYACFNEDESHYVAYIVNSSLTVEKQNTNGIWIVVGKKDFVTNVKDVVLYISQDTPYVAYTTIPINGALENKVEVMQFNGVEWLKKYSDTGDGFDCSKSIFVTDKIMYMAYARKNGEIAVIELDTISGKLKKLPGTTETISFITKEFEIGSVNTIYIYVDPDYGYVYVGYQASDGVNKITTTRFWDRNTSKWGTQLKSFNKYDNFKNWEEWKLFLLQELVSSTVYKYNPKCASNVNPRK